MRLKYSYAARDISSIACSPSASLFKYVVITQSAYGLFFANTMPASTRTPSSSPGLSAVSTSGGSPWRSRLTFGFFSSANAPSRPAGVSPAAGR